MILGAQKCATTTLFQTLSSHPRLAGSRPKEPHFFSTTPDWQQHLTAYHSNFPDRPSDALLFEASTSYTFLPHRRLEIWNDLYAYNPELRFIYVVRRPLDRIVSAYMHNYLRGYTSEPVDQVVRRHPLYLDATRYHAQITPFIRRFGRDRVLLLDFDDLIERRTDVLRQVTDFLDIDFAGLTESEPVHANKSANTSGHHHRFRDPGLGLRSMRRLSPRLYDTYARKRSPSPIEKPELAPSFRRALLHMLESDIDQLGGLMGRDLSHWLSEPPSG